MNRELAKPQDGNELTNHVVKDKDAHPKAEQEEGQYNNSLLGKIENLKVSQKTTFLMLIFLHLAEEVSESISRKF